MIRLSQIKISDMISEELQKYITLAEASIDTPYSQEYLSLLARRGKIPAKKLGRNWHTTKVAVEEYIKKQEAIFLTRKNKTNLYQQVDETPRANLPIPQKPGNALIKNLAQFLSGKNRLDDPQPLAKKK